MKKSFDGYLTASSNVDIQFQDVDVTGDVWHGHYFRFLEVARVALLESIGYSYGQMRESGYLWPVIDSRIRYLKPFHLGQTVFVTACLSEWELRLVVDYRLDNESGRTCTRARTVQVPVKAGTMELQLGCPKVLICKVEKAMLEKQQRKA